MQKKIDKMQGEISQASETLARGQAELEDSLRVDYGEKFTRVDESLESQKGALEARITELAGSTTAEFDKTEQSIAQAKSDARNGISVRFSSRSPTGR